MKNTFIAICCIIVAFAGCKENDTPLDFGSSGTSATDSTYVLAAASIPAVAAHNVLIEEFSGQSCNNCPAAHSALEGLAATGNVNIICYYINDFIQTTPPKTAKYDFRDSTASDVGNTIFGGILQMPIGCVDRVPVSGALLETSGTWSSTVTTRKAVIDSINLDVESTLVGGVATIKATVTYLKPISTQQNLSIAIVEDSMVDIQEISLSATYPSGYDTFYTYTDVFRAMVTSEPLGDPILGTMATKEAGRVFWRKYTYTPKTKTPAINTARCRVIAFINSPGASGDYHIIQSASVHL